MDRILRLARESDIAAIEEVLKAEALPPLQVREWLASFWVLEASGRVVGCAGIERYGESVVLRSVAVTPELRGTGEGMRLVRHALDSAIAGGAARAYLFTASGAGFFARFGFETCDIEDFEPAAQQCWQWQFVASNEAMRPYVTAMRADLSLLARS